MRIRFGQMSTPAPRPAWTAFGGERAMRMATWLGAWILLVAHAQGAAAQGRRPADDKPKTKVPTATPAEALKVMKDFKAELLYSVPKDVEGSWVNMAVDPKGRLIVSDQYGPLYRITPAAIGDEPDETEVEKLDL